MTSSGTTISHPPASHRILVVDDEETVLSVLCEILGRQNYDVVAVGSPAAALAELRAGPFAVIISDQRMPGLTGLELLHQARQLQPLATRILMTGVVSLDLVIDALNHGEIYRFIVKPWLREELLATLQNAVQRHELLRQNVQLQTAAETLNEQVAALNRSLAEQAEAIARHQRELLQLRQALEQNLFRAAELSLRMAETFDPPLGEQGRRAAQLCRAMAQVLDLAAAERRALENAALLHDIGLIAAPRSLLRRWRENPQNVEADERALLERHPVLGQELSAWGEGFESVGALIRVHHERMDGAGYPDRLAGDQIPWLGRLLAVATAFAAHPHAEEQAVETIRQQAHTAFDPEAIRVFLRARPLLPLRREKQIRLSELQPGMVPVRGIYAADGRLLAAEGRPLNPATIEQLREDHRLQSVQSSLTVYC
jgi:response regulator RpfG family c-di-GMP phosphodiesterase